MEKGRLENCIFLHFCIFTVMLALSLLVASAASPGKRPSFLENYKLARWLVHENSWGVAATISNGHDSGVVGNAWPNQV